MHFIIYKVTNKINGKHYIGMHKTDNLDDGYMGSGKLIKRAIKKYGTENFVKQILHIFDNEKDMKDKEKELVVLNETSYNLCDGGHGGFGYINKNNLQVNNTQKESARLFMTDMNKNRSKEMKLYCGRKSAEVRKSRKQNGIVYKKPSTDHLNTLECIEKRTKTMRENGHQKGNKNSQYGRPRSEETKQKIRETMLANKLANTPKQDITLL